MDGNLDQDGVRLDQDSFYAAAQWVAIQRDTLKELTVQVQAGRALWDADNQALLAGIVEVQIELEAAEGRLRNMALLAYQKTGTTKPGPGLHIQLRTRLAYDAADALAWATRHGIALALDRRVFELLAKAQPIPFVELRQEAIVTLEVTQ